MVPPWNVDHSTFSKPDAHMMLLAGEGQRNGTVPRSWLFFVLRHFIGSRTGLVEVAWYEKMRQVYSTLSGFQPPKRSGSNALRSKPKGVACLCMSSATRWPAQGNDSEHLCTNAVLKGVGKQAQNVSRPTQCTCYLQQTTSTKR